MMDELDRLILETLQEDGRTPFTQIAKHAGVAESTIRTRYKNLVDEGVCRTVSIVDPFALGFQAPAIIQVNVQPGTIEQVAQAIASLPEVSYLLLTLGNSDLLVEVYCRDLAHITRLITEHMHQIPGVLATETLMVAKAYKLSYRWSPSAIESEQE
jgi:Lrp/AsnC family transcriptional regulator for asnA, asnC and gidA